jgi:cytochrome b
VRGPRATLAYARRVLAGREPRHLGHNPLGGWMVLALFACILGLALTGWLYTTDRFWGDETVERVHVALAWTMLALGRLHVGGVLLGELSASRKPRRGDARRETRERRERRRG